MDKKSLLNRINNLYQKEGINITDYLKNIENSSNNSVEDILISYDFQAGSYSKSYEEDPEKKRVHLKKVLKTMNEMISPCKSILEIGIGEGTSMIEIIKGLNTKPEKIYGFDISWSRTRYAKQILEKYNIDNTTLFTADLFNIPFADSSIDLVYTIHALEPNGGREEEALKELYRISKKYILLVEPCYEIANEESKLRMDKLGYIKGLKNTILNLGYNLIFEEMLENDVNPLNRAKIYIIEKKTDNENSSNLCCPITKSKLDFINNNYYSKDSFLVYPIIDGIPCLLSENAIIATKFLEFAK